MIRPLVMLHLVSWSLVTATLFFASSYIPPSTLGFLVPDLRWFPLVDITRNTYHAWRLDHVCRFVLSVLGWNLVDDVVPMQLSLFAFGTAFALKRLGGDLMDSPFVVWPMAFLVTLSIVFVTGRDPVTWGAIAWVPLLTILLSVVLAVTRQGRMRAAGPIWLVLGFVSIEHAHSANQVACITAIGALALSWWVEPQLRQHRALPRNGTLVIVGIALLPAILATVTMPLASFPDYPPLAHVVPLSGVASITRPLVGPDYPIPTIHRAALRTLFGFPSAVLLAGLSVTLLFAVRSGSRALQIVLFVSTAGIGSVVFDVWFRESAAVIGPVASLSRLVPGATLLYLGTIILAAGIWLASLALISAGPSIATLPWMVGVIAAAIMSPWLQQSVLSLADRAQFITSARENEDLRRVIVSPSLFVIRHYLRTLPDLLAKLPEYTALSTARMTSANVESPILSTPDEALSRGLDRMLDDKEKTRWSTRTGRQIGGETLRIQFPAAVTLRGIELATGAFPADFPRGLIVSKIDCADGAQVEWSVDFPEWQGSLVFTPAGFPFFSGQSEVKVLFGKPEEVQCLSIEQTGTAPFDWSIAELRILDVAGSS